MAPQNFARRNCLVASFECFVQFVFGSPDIEYQGIFESRRNILSVPWTTPSEFLKMKVDSQKVTVNPTQKPVAFWNDLILSVKNCGLVIDAFAGTGSASEAAIRNHKYLFAIN